MSDEMAAQLTALEEMVRIQLAGQMLQQGVDHLLTAFVAFEQAAQVPGLREDMLSYATSLVAMLTPVVEAAGTLAKERAEAINAKEEGTEDA